MIYLIAATAFATGALIPPNRGRLCASEVEGIVWRRAWACSPESTGVSLYARGSPPDSLIMRSYSSSLHLGLVFVMSIAELIHPMGPPRAGLEDPDIPPSGDAWRFSSIP